VSTRRAIVPLAILALSCSGGTEPPADTVVAGLWNASVTTDGQLPGGQAISCSTSWVMRIDSVTTSGALEMTTFVPFTPQYTCDNGSTSTWEYSTFTFLVRQNGPDVVFLTTSRLDTFLVATVSGSTMSGRLGTRFYSDGAFRATRRTGSDPNLGPGILTVGVNAGSPVMEIGDTLRAGAQVADGYGRTLDTLPDWTSSAPATMTVDADGLIHGLSPGSAWIVGRLGSLRDSIAVTVLTPAASVEFTYAPDTLIFPNQLVMVAVAKDALGQPVREHRLTWESSDPSVATAEPGGIITPVAPGTVSITASSTGVSASATLHVLPAIATIDLGAAGTVVPIGGTLQVTATPRDALGNVLPGRLVHWDVSDGSIITVDTAGLVTGVGSGSATVIVTAESVTGTLDLTVP
jgi:uncharacterized protein YjdB